MSESSHQAIFRHLRDCSSMRYRWKQAVVGRDKVWWILWVNNISQSSIQMLSTAAIFAVCEANGVMQQNHIFVSYSTFWSVLDQSKVLIDYLVKIRKWYPITWLDFTWWYSIWCQKNVVYDTFLIIQNIQHCLFSKAIRFCGQWCT